MGDGPTAESETTAGTEPPADSYLGNLGAEPTESATEPPADSSYLGNLYPSMEIHSKIFIIVCDHDVTILAGTVVKSTHY